MKTDNLTLMQQAQLRQFELAAQRMDKDRLIYIALKLMVLLFSLNNVIQSLKGATSEKP